jgi:hypothetical protein
VAARPKAWPELVALDRQLHHRHRRRPKISKEIAAELVQRGFMNERSQPLPALSIASLLLDNVSAEVFGARALAKLRVLRWVTDLLRGALLPVRPVSTVTPA